MCNAWKQVTESTVIYFVVLNDPECIQLQYALRGKCVLVSPHMHCLKLLSYHRVFNPVTSTCDPIAQNVQIAHFNLHQVIKNMRVVEVTSLWPLCTLCEVTRVKMWMSVKLPREWCKGWLISDVTDDLLCWASLLHSSFKLSSLCAGVSSLVWLWP